MNFMEDVDIKNLRILDLKSSGMHVNSRERWNEVRWYWRLYIKYVGGGGRRVFAGPIKRFRHILTEQKILLKIFDGPLMFSFPNFDFLSWRSVWAQNVQTSNPGHNILRHSDVWKIFVSPQMKRIVIISNKHGISDLAHELPNDLRLRTLGN